MNEIEKSRVQEITVLHGEIIISLKISLEKAIRIGQLITEQKESMRHGGYIKWCEENLPFTSRTARSYKNLYKNRYYLKMENVSDLSEAYRQIKKRQIFEQKLEERREKARTLPFKTPEYLKPEKGEDRKVELHKNIEERMLRIEIGPNENGIKIKERLNRFQDRSEYQKRKAEIDKIKKEIDFLEDEIEELENKECKLGIKQRELEKEVYDLEWAMKKDISIDLEAEYGPVYTHTETFDYRVISEELWEELLKMKKDDVIDFLIERRGKDKVKPLMHGYLGDINLFAYSKQHWKKSDWQFTTIGSYH